MLVTDSRFNVRLLVHSSPGQGTDTYGNTCQYMALPYKKLQLKVGIRTQGGSAYVATHVFNDVSVDSCSSIVLGSFISSSCSSSLIYII